MNKNKKSDDKKSDDKKLVIRILCAFLFMIFNTILLILAKYLNINGKITDKNMVIISKCYKYSFYLFILIFIIIYLMHFISFIKYLLHLRKVNLIEYDGNPIFKKIDYFIWGLSKNNLYYLDSIRYIIEIYEDVRMKEIVYDKNIEELYKRKKFITNGIDIDTELTTVLSSLILSIVASVLFSIASDDKNQGLVFLGTIILTVIFVLVVMVIKYIVNGQEVGFRNELLKYELSLLDKLILEIIEKINNETEFNKNKRNILSILAECRYTKYNKMGRKKVFRKIKEKIAILQNIIEDDNLDINLYTKICVNDKDIFFYLDCNRVNKDYIKYKKKNNKTDKTMSKEEYILNYYTDKNYDDIFLPNSKMVYEYFKEFHII